MKKAKQIVRDMIGRDDVRQLPIITRNGKKYYIDERLRQLRNINNPHDYIDLEDK